jgi:predicted peptidase
MGGYGAWILATAYPDRFAALVSVSGSGYRTQHMPGEDVLCRLEEVAVWGIHGLEDRISAPEASKLFAAALKTSCEGEVRWTQYEDAGHLETSEIAYRDPALYAWMLEHSR